MNSEARYRARAVGRVEHTGLVCDLLSGTALSLPRNAARMLSECKAFETLDNHLERTVSDFHLNPAEREQLKSVFEGFLREGFLLSDVELMNKIRAEPAAIPPQISTVGILTSNRPISLGRCIESVARSCVKQCRRVDMRVFDDSERPWASVVVDGCRPAVSALGCSLRYCGRSQKRDLADALVTAGSPREIVNFALFDPEVVGRPIGANRNALLIETAGTPIVGLDDDVVWDVFSSPALERRVRPYSGYNPSNLWMFAQRDEAFRFVSPTDLDLFAEYEEMLGASPRQAFRTGISRRAGQSFGHELMGSVMSGSGVIVAIMSGLVGDCGFGSTGGYLTTSGKLRERTMRSEESYRNALTSRWVVHVVDESTVADSPYCMSYALAMDGRQLLPPFFPVRRNQDGVWGAVVQRLYPPGAMGHLPYAIRHEPPEARFNDPDEVWNAAGAFGIAELAIELVRTFEPDPHASVEICMKALGRHLSDIGRLDGIGFTLLVQNLRLEEARCAIGRVEAALERYGGEPDYWAADCRRYLDKYYRILSKADYGVPRDICAGRPQVDTMALAQRLIRRYGELLIEWPEIMEVARLL